MLVMAALLLLPASSLAAEVAVLGNNATDETLTAAGHDVTLVTDAEVATPGFLDGTLNGVAGFRITWTFVDGGAIANDRVQARIVRLSDGAVIRTISGTPSGGTGHFALAPTP